MDDVLVEEKVPLSARKSPRRGHLKCPDVHKEFGGQRRGYEVTQSVVDEVLAEEEAPLGTRKLLRQGQLKRPAVQNEFEGQWQGC